MGYAPQLSDIRAEGKTTEEVVRLLVKQVNSLSQQLQLGMSNIGYDDVYTESGESLDDVLDNFYSKGETNSLLNGKSNAGHVHDERYYTESEADSLLALKSDTSHTHDDRYYTESEITTLLGGKADITSGSALPTASSSYRGKFFYLLGGQAIADILYVCIKNAADTYEWVAL